MNKAEIIAKCLGIAHSNYLNVPHIRKSVTDLYAVNGFENKASGICHYCSIDVLKEIINNNCLRFTDICYLNDSTEFMEIIPVIECVIRNGNYNSDFQKFILDSDALSELKDYKQSYFKINRETNNLENKLYRTYTCSFSTNKDSLNMWNYYASNEGVNICFDFAWNMFKGSNITEVNVRNELENNIIMYRGLMIYNDDEKQKCVAELLSRLERIYLEVKDTLDENASHIYYAFKEAINYMRCFFKNIHFISEEEYRVVLKIPEDVIRADCVGDEIKNRGFFKRGNVLIPYIDYNFSRQGIERITLNPYIKENDSMFELGIKDLLWINGLEKTKVVHSNIPIRKYD